MVSERFIERLAPFVVTACVLTTVLAAMRTFGGAKKPIVTRAPYSLSAQISGWDSLLVSGDRMGPDGASVIILEFADFECPFCRRFTRGPLAAIRQRYPEDVAVVYRHFPLPYHTSARAAAKASECAGNQKRFEEMHDVLYSIQDWTQTPSFNDLATRAGVVDLAAFARCLDSKDVEGKIDKDFADAVAFGARATPTVVVNGLRFSIPPDIESLDSIIRVLLKR